MCRRGCGGIDSAMPATAHGSLTHSANHRAQTRLRMVTKVLISGMSCARVSPEKRGIPLHICQGLTFAEYPTECSGPPHLLGPWGLSAGVGIRGLLVPWPKPADPFFQTSTTIRHAGVASRSGAAQRFTVSFGQRLVFARAKKKAARRGGLSGSGLKDPIT